MERLKTSEMIGTLLRQQNNVVEELNIKVTDSDEKVKQ